MVNDIDCEMKFLIPNFCGTLISGIENGMVPYFAQRWNQNGVIYLQSEIFDIPYLA